MDARAVIDLLHRHEAAILGASSLLAFLLFWQAAATLGWASELFISSPVKIAGEFAVQRESGEMAKHFGASLLSFVLGLGFASFVGIGLGLAGGWFRDLEAALDPFVWFKYSAPTIAFYPIFVAWLGYGTPTVVAIAFLFAVTPVYANALSGMKSVDRDLVRTARAFGATPLDIFLKIALPASVPIIVNGLRLAAGRALTGVVVAELFVSNEGLGYAIAYHGQLLQTTKMMVPVVIVVLLGVTLSLFLSLLEAHVDKWRRR